MQGVMHVICVCSNCCIVTVCISYTADLLLVSWLEIQNHSNLTRHNMSFETSQWPILYALYLYFMKYPLQLFCDKSGGSGIGICVRVLLAFPGLFTAILHLGPENRCKLI